MTEEIHRTCKTCGGRGFTVHEQTHRIERTRCTCGGTMYPWARPDGEHWQWGRACDRCGLRIAEHFPWPFAGATAGRADWDALGVEN